MEAMPMTDPHTRYSNKHYDDKVEEIMMEDSDRTTEKIAHIKMLQKDVWLFQEQNRELRTERDVLKAERDNNYMIYRSKYDVETKKLHFEIERLKGELELANINAQIDLGIVRDAYERDAERYRKTIKMQVAEVTRLNEIISHLPHVPTESYEKEMAKEIFELRAEVDTANSLADAYLEGSAEWEHEAILAKRELASERAKSLKYREALEYYSHPDHYEPRISLTGERRAGILTEGGRKARQLLFEDMSQESQNDDTSIEHGAERDE